MSKIEKVLNMIDKIKGSLPPAEYVRIDDIRAMLIQKKSKKETLFDRAIQELKMGGDVEVYGNQIRLNQ